MWHVLVMSATGKTPDNPTAFFKDIEKVLRRLHSSSAMTDGHNQEGTKTDLYGVKGSLAVERDGRRSRRGQYFHSIEYYAYRRIGRMEDGRHQSQ